MIPGWYDIANIFPGVTDTLFFRVRSRLVLIVWLHGKILLLTVRTVILNIEWLLLRDLSYAPA